MLSDGKNKIHHRIVHKAAGPSLRRPRARPRRSSQDRLHRRRRGGRRRWLDINAKLELFILVPCDDTSSHRCTRGGTGSGQARVTCALARAGLGALEVGIQELLKSLRIYPLRLAVRRLERRGQVVREPPVGAHVAVCGPRDVGQGRGISSNAPTEGKYAPNLRK
jgi:hypothetical protein